MKVLSYDLDACVGCYVCEEVCSETWFKVTDAEKSSIRIHDDGQGNFSAVFCNQCGDCIEVCPTQALYRDRKGIVVSVPMGRCSITPTRPSPSSASPAGSVSKSAPPRRWRSMNNER